MKNENEKKELNVNKKDIYVLELATYLLLDNEALLKKYDIDKLELALLASQLKMFSFKNRTFKLFAFNNDIISKIATTVVDNYFEEKDNSILVKSFENYKKECTRTNKECEDILIREIVGSLFKLI